MSTTCVSRCMITIFYTLKLVEGLYYRIVLVTYCSMLKHVFFVMDICELQTVVQVGTRIPGLLCI